MPPGSDTPSKPPQPGPRPPSLRKEWKHENKKGAAKPTTQSPRPVRSSCPPPFNKNHPHTTTTPPPPPPPPHPPKPKNTPPPPPSLPPPHPPAPSVHLPLVPRVLRSLPRPWGPSSPRAFSPPTPRVPPPAAPIPQSQRTHRASPRYPYRASPASRPSPAPPTSPPRIPPPPTPAPVIVRGALTSSSRAPSPARRQRRYTALRGFASTPGCGRPPSVLLLPA
jgi:hypothetical protein